MAALPGAPRTWTNSEITTEAMFDAEISGSLAYLKGQAGPVTYDNVVSTTKLGIGVTPPAARLHVVEAADAYAALIENVKTTGTPHGLQVNTNKSGTHRALAVSTRDAIGALTERLGIDADGRFFQNSVQRWPAPVTAALTGAGFVVPAAWTMVTSTGVAIPRGGWWFVQVHMIVHTGGPDFGDYLDVAVAGPGIAATGTEQPLLHPGGMVTYRCNGGTRTNSPQSMSAGRPMNFTGPGTIGVWARVEGTQGAFTLGQPTVINAWYMGGAG